MKLSASFLIRRLCALFSLVGALTVMSGCAAVIAGTAVGVGAVVFVRGELQAGLDRNFDSVVRASNRAMEELEFKKISLNKDALTAIVTAYTVEETKVQIKVLRSAEKTSEVHIRVGLMGNESVSRTVLEKIKENL